MPPAPRRCPRRRRSTTAAGSEGKGTIQGEAGFLPRRPHGAACGAGGQLWQRAAGPDRQRPGAGKPAATLPAGLRVLGRRPGLGKGLPFAAPPGVPPRNPKGSGGETKAGEKGAERPRGKKSSKPPCGLFARAIGRSAKPWRRPLLAASPPPGTPAQAPGGCGGGRGRELQQGWKPSRQGTSPGGLAGAHGSEAARAPRGSERGAQLSAAASRHGDFCARYDAHARPRKSNKQTQT